MIEAQLCSVRWATNEIPINSTMTKCSISDNSTNDLVLKENIKKALSRIENLAYVTALSDNCMGGFAFDFIICLSETKVYAIIATYDNSKYLQSDKIKEIESSINTAKPSDDFYSFLVVTNSQIRQEDKSKLQTKCIRIEFSEGAFKSEDLFTSIKSYHEKLIIEFENAQPAHQC